MNQTNKQKKRNEMKNKLKSPYFLAYYTLKFDLEMLEELNKRLPKSANQIIDETERYLDKRLKEVDKKTKTEFEELIQLFRKSLERKPLKSEELISAIKSFSERAQVLFIDHIQNLTFYYKFNQFIRDMSLVYLIAEIESFLQKTLEISFQKNPAILMTCQKSVTYEELLKFENINDARQQIIDKEILSIVNQDIEDINKYFEQRFKVEISRFVNWEKFKERFYRRNILVHNLGMPNRFYRLKTGYKGKDKRMNVSQKYLEESIKLFDKMTLKISEYFYNKF